MIPIISMTWAINSREEYNKNRSPQNQDSDLAVREKLAPFNRLLIKVLDAQTEILLDPNGA